jgi:sugar phosphate isomerase/epimerase
MQIDFPAVAKALKDIGYAGELTLEADAYLRGRTADNIFEGMQNMASAAKRLDELMK